MAVSPEVEVITNGRNASVNTLSEKGEISMTCNKKLSGKGTVLLAMFLVAFTGVFNSARGETYKLKLQLAWHTQHPQYTAYMEFIERLKKETKGSLKLIVFPASQLIGTNEALDGLKSGTIDMLAGCASYYHGMVPEGDVDWLPYISLNQREKLWDFMNSTEGGAASEVHDIIANSYLEKANAIWLTNVICGSSGIIGRANNEYATVESIKNINLRAAGGVGTRIVKAWGANPVTLATGEIYPALQMGTVDALLFYAYGLKDYKFFEVAKTFTTPPIFTWADDLWINKQSMEKLPKEIQTAIIKVSREWGRWASVTYWPAYEGENEVWCKEKGVKFIAMDQENIEKTRVMMEDVWDWYASESPGCKRMVQLFRIARKEWQEK
jgi:TRAP-type C4-dicarboxylate transport system substrate-binding protein